MPIRFFRLIKNLTADGYYTSRVGLLEELGYIGNTFRAGVPGLFGAGALRRARSDFSARRLTGSREKARGQRPTTAQPSLRALRFSPVSVASAASRNAHRSQL